jgi:uncharacterized membrane protein/plastocyanin
VNQEILEWLHLLGRWLHITVAVTWIGTSIFFMWLDRSIEKSKESNIPGHLGDLWMVHGGGFYHVQKLMMGPTKVPESLHWFKWESYWTWLSGIFLLVLIFYSGNGTFLLDSTVSSISFVQAILISAGSILLSWFFYDFLWESKLAEKKTVIGHALTLSWFAAVTYFLCHTLSGRAAYIHIGAMLGTWMTANVFLRIIPRQIKMVEASRQGETVNPLWAKNAKNRSTHNTYFTLPVIFIMLSNHFPSTYGHRYAWLILLAISAAGAAIREYFVCRISQPKRSRAFGVIGSCILLLVLILTSSKNTSQANRPAGLHNDLQPAMSAQDVKKNQTPSVQGKIFFDGNPPPPEKLSLPMACGIDSGSESDLLSNEVLVKDGLVQNALVWISAGLDPKANYPTPTTSVLLDQKKCQYVPRVVAAQVGQSVEIINSDPTFHNVKAISKNNPEFNDAMPAQNDRIFKTFHHSEIFVQTKCSVHPWMTANIAVLEHPYFAVTLANGEYNIYDLPPGTYTLQVWHERFGTLKKTITLKQKDSNAISAVATEDFHYQ